MGGGGVELTHHASSLDPPEYEPHREVRGKTGISDKVHAVHIVGDGVGHNKEIISVLVARGVHGCFDDTSYPF